MAQFENITQTMQVQNPILASYVSIYMYKIQRSASMKKKGALQFLKRSDLFQSWTVTRLGPDPDRLVFEMSSAFIGPEFPQVKLPKATDLTWEGREGYLAPCPLLCLRLCLSALLLPSDPAVFFIEMIG